jgi:hypothetical protein
MKGASGNTNKLGIECRVAMLCKLHYAELCDVVRKCNKIKQMPFPSYHSHNGHFLNLKSRYFNANVPILGGQTLTT